MVPKTFTATWKAPKKKMSKKATEICKGADTKPIAKENLYGH